MKRNYQHMMQQVKPDEQMVQEIMTQAHKHPVRRMSRTRRVLRPVAAVVAVCVCLNFTLSALAANSDTAYVCGLTGACPAFCAGQSDMR